MLRRVLATSRFDAAPTASSPSTSSSLVPLTLRRFRFHDRPQYIASDEELLKEATQNVRMILKKSVNLQPMEKLVVLSQARTPLAKALTQAYLSSDITAKPYVRHLDFETTPSEEIKEELSYLREGDLVVTVQDEENTYKLENNYRLRARLFQIGVKNIDHKFLSDVRPVEHLTFLESLGFDPQIEGPVARSIKKMLDSSSKVVVETFNSPNPLTYSGPLEKALLNIGDYSEMKNIGGTFPVGEIISELVDLTHLNGDFMVFGFADLQKRLCIPERPFRVSIKSGVVVDYDRENGPSSFGELLEAIRADETDVWVRELGLGLNEAMSKTRVVDNITTFERMRGMHVSLGKKHNVFKGRNGSKWHADLFVDLERITIDGFPAYHSGKFHLKTESDL